MTRPRSDPLAESLSGQFKLLGELGRGGMGVVYRARDVGSGRDVALKVILSPSERRLERFRREGQAVAALSHPNVVRVHSAGETPTQAWLAYELVEDARSLELAFDDLEQVERLELVRDVARGVGHAHQAGVVHRDLKPDNVLVDLDGVARVTDFGLAVDEDHERLTRTGAIVGTPSYMSPEQIGGPRESVGPPTDVWALGVILYQALTDRLPFDGDSLLNLAANICESKVTPPSRLSSSVGRGAEAVCLRALERDPAERYPHADALADDLERVLAGSSPLAGKRSRLPKALLAAALALTVAGGVWSATRRELDVAPPPTAPAPEGVSVTVKPLPSSTAEAFVWLEGSVDPADAPLVVTRGEWRAPVRPRGGVFRLRVPLEPGSNTITVAHRRRDDLEPTRVEVERLVVPSWFSKLRHRPPLPLPSGVRFGTSSGEYVNVKDLSVLVWVPPGSFRMGDDSSGFMHGNPEQQVEIERGFFIGKLEVTWEQFLRFCRETGVRLPANMNVLAGAQHGYEGMLAGEREARLKEASLFRAGANHPAFRVTWDGASAYCQWAGLRLPREAEWEFAARGPGGGSFPWGDEPKAELLNATGNLDGHTYPAPVGSFPEGVSPFGALDMAGNVWEWVQEKAVTSEDAQTVVGALRITKGGAYNCILPLCRSTHRDRRRPTGFLWHDQGFRVARSVD